MMLTKKSFPYVIIVCLIAINSSVNAATSGILNNEDVAVADVSVLREEAMLFETIKQGVVLMISDCELAKPCSLNVTQDELRQLITKLESRITMLAIRRSESGEKDLEEILLSYVDARDGYNKMLDKLIALSQMDENKSEEAGKEDIFNDVEENTKGAKNKKDLYNDLFDDVDEDL